MAVDKANPAEDSDEAFAVLADAFARFEEIGMRLPPVPRELLAELDEFTTWSWGSDELVLEDLGGFLDEARQAGGAPEVGFGHVGHGVSSWWLCYRLKLDAVAVFLRVAFGGAYTDSEAAAAQFNVAAELLEPLIPAAEAAKRAGRLQPGHRLIVVLDGAGSRFWEVAGKDREPHETDDPLGAAMDFLSRPVLLDQP